MPARLVSRGRLWSFTDEISGYYEILPYIEQSGLYNAINLGDRAGAKIFSALDPVNSTAYATRVAAFTCPSDYHTDDLDNGPNSYRFNVGSSDPLDWTDALSAGAFHPVRTLGPAEYRDGLSQTAGLSERLIGGQREGQFERTRDYWCAGVNGVFAIPDDDATLRVCRSLSGEPRDFMTNLGHSWMLGGGICLWYNHVAPPNDLSPDCSTGDGNTSDPLSCHRCSIAPRSYHSSGVHCLMMDGSARFISSSIGLSVWRAMGTRSGGELSRD
jgi:hypothetical protein